MLIGSTPAFEQIISVLLLDVETATLVAPLQAHNQQGPSTVGVLHLPLHANWEVRNLSFL